MKKETKRQHFVPKTYLQKFAFKRKKNYNIYAINKNNLRNSIFINVSNICIEKDFYSLSGDTEEKRQALETFYSNHIENEYNEVYDTLIDESINEISEELHLKIITTIITMLYRTSKWVHMHNDLFNRVLGMTFELCRQSGKNYFFFGGLRYSVEGKTLNEVKEEFRLAKKDILVLTQLEVAFRLIEIRKVDVIMVSKLQDDHELITSDNPVISSNPNSEHVLPFDPENMIMLPLNSHHILTILPHSESIGDHRIVRTVYNGIMSQSKMMINNSSQFENCYKYILGKKEYI